MAAVNPASDSRELILASAEKLMARHGVGKSSLADIAAEAGVSRGTLYWHFPSKEELILGIAEAHMEGLTGKFVALAESRGTESLETVIEDLIGEILADETRSNLHMHLMHEVFEGAKAVRTRMARSYADWRGMAARQFERHGLPPREALDSGALLVAAIDGLIMQRKVAANRDRKEVDEDARRVARLLAGIVLSTRAPARGQAPKGR